MSGFGMAVVMESDLTDRHLGVCKGGDELGQVIILSNGD